MSLLTGSANAVKYTLFGFNLIFLVSISDIRYSDESPIAIGKEIR